MTEDDLLAGITEALTICGWRWTHIRRSDRITMGHVGLPDIIAVHSTRASAPVLAWELKTERGQLTTDQLAWILALAGRDSCDARVIRPADYDAALKVIVHGWHPATAFGGSET